MAAIVPNVQVWLMAGPEMLFSGEGRLPFDAAQSFCADNGGRLVVPDTPAMQAAVFAHCAETKKGEECGWMGVRCPKGSQCNDKGFGEWRWLMGEDLSRAVVPGKLRWVATGNTKAKCATIGTNFNSARAQYCESLQYPICERVQMDKKAFEKAYPDAVPDSLAKIEASDDNDPLSAVVHAKKPKAVDNGATEEGSFFKTEPIKDTVQEKTLEVWARIANLEQMDAHYMEIRSFANSSMPVWDGIVYQSPFIEDGGMVAAGSDGGLRTQDVKGANETTYSMERFTHWAITYENDLDRFAQMTIYRNGEPYGLQSPYSAGEIINYVMGASQVEIGRDLEGRVLCARFYDFALTEPDVRHSYAKGCNVEKTWNEVEWFPVFNDANNDDVVRQFDRAPPSALRRKVSHLLVYTTTGRCAEGCEVILHKSTTLQAILDPLPSKRI
jgi:hypothetical protein